MRVKLKLVSTSELESAMVGLSLSRNRDPSEMPNVFKKLWVKADQHNKYLRMIDVTLDMTFPRYFWQQFDTYKIGVNCQSESTMYTLTKKPLTQLNFCRNLPEEYLEYLNDLIIRFNKETPTCLKSAICMNLKNSLPEGFLQRRIVKVNLQTLKRIYFQRSKHKLLEWVYFCDFIKNEVYKNFEWIDSND